jgi:hypothetical protein
VGENKETDAVQEVDAQEDHVNDGNDRGSDSQEPLKTKNDVELPADTLRIDAPTSTAPSPSSTEPKTASAQYLVINAPSPPSVLHPHPYSDDILSSVPPTRQSPSLLNAENRVMIGDSNMNNNNLLLSTQQHSTQLQQPFYGPSTQSLLYSPTQYLPNSIPEPHHMSSNATIMQQFPNTVIQYSPYNNAAYYNPQYGPGGGFIQHPMKSASSNSVFQTSSKRISDYPNAITSGAVLPNVSLSESIEVQALLQQVLDVTSGNKTKAKPPTLDSASSPMLMKYISDVFTTAPHIDTVPPPSSVVGSSSTSSTAVITQTTAGGEPPPTTHGKRQSSHKPKSERTKRRASSPKHSDNDAAEEERRTTYLVTSTNPPSLLCDEFGEPLPPAVTLSPRLQQSSSVTPTSQQQLPSSTADHQNINPSSSLPSCEMMMENSSSSSQTVVLRTDVKSKRKTKKAT